MLAQKTSGEALEVLDAGLRLCGVALGNWQVGNVLGETALEVAELGAVDDGLRIHQCRRRHHKAIRLNVAQPREVVGKCGVFWWMNGHR